MNYEQTHKQIDNSTISLNDSFLCYSVNNKCIEILVLSSNQVCRQWMFKWGLAWNWDINSTNMIFIG